MTNEEAQSISDANHKNQKNLLDGLMLARRYRKLSTEDVARVLGVDTEIMADIDAGRWEFTLDELRDYAYACGAVIEYQIVLSPPN